MRKQSENRKFLIIFICLILISIPFRLYHLTYPILDSFNFRQAQTATIALNFYKYGINFFNTQLDMFGVGREKYLLLEFPLYEALVATLYKLFSYSEIWGRIVSMSAGYIGALYLYKITEFITKNRQTALFSALFFLFVPLNLFYHRAFMIDPTIIAFLLSGTFYFLKYCDSKSSKDYLLTILLLTLSFLQKGLYGPFWLIPMTVYWLKKNPLRSIFRFDFMCLIGIPFALLFSWQTYENWLNLAHGQTFFTTLNQSHREWNMGTLADRLYFPLWQLRLRQILNGTMLKPGLFLFIIGLFAAKKLDKSSFLYSFLISQVLYFLVLFRIQTQNYYQLVLIPVFSLFMAVGLSKISYHISSRSLRALVLSLFFVFYIGKSWQNTLPSFYVDWNWYRQMVKMGELLPENSYGIFTTAGYDWNSGYSYYLKKKLLTATVEDINENKIKDWQKEGYSFLIVYDENKSLTRLRQLGLPNHLDLLSKFPEIYHKNNIRILQL